VAIVLFLAITLSNVLQDQSKCLKIQSLQLEGKSTARCHLSTTFTVRDRARCVAVTLPPEEIDVED
jgi:hypothetical protein